MAKTCPSCGYGPIGPYIDNCPICAEPVRNVRSGDSGWGRPSGVLRWVLGGAVVVALGIAGCCGLGIWRMGQAVKDAEKQMKEAQAQVEADRKTRTVAVDAAEVLREFEADADAADRKYGGKYLEISGIVDHEGVGRFEMPFVVIHGGEDKAKLMIECFFDMADAPDRARIRRLQKGQRITFRGEYDGRVSHIQLRECVFVE